MVFRFLALSVICLSITLDRKSYNISEKATENMGLIWQHWCLACVFEEGMKLLQVTKARLTNRKVQ
jgi:hypothetical protein